MKLAKARVVPAGDSVLALPAGSPLKLALDVDAYMAAQHSAALLVVHDGRLRLERYGLDFDGNGRWTSFSVAKSITSVLVGAALRDGFIRSMDDKVSDYIPEMKGSAYDEVSIRQLLTVTSGVRWNEDYADPDSDVASFDGQGIAPEGWLSEATTARSDIGVADRGDGYQWWTHAAGSFAARRPPSPELRRVQASSGWGVSSPQRARRASIRTCRQVHRQSRPA